MGNSTTAACGIKMLVEKCGLCEQKMNPTVKIYNNDTRLCKTCFDHMENMPDVVAKCVERFLIGNVV
jgi:recombinational DNA repair protein (RecF pathway)